MMNTEKTTEVRWFADEVQPHEASLRAYLRGAFPSVRDVDDVVQESFLRIWRARALQPILSARSYLFKVARSLAIDLIRHDRVTRITPVTDIATLPVLEDRPGAAESASVNQEIALLLEAIDALPFRCREIFILRKLQGVSQKEIAQRLGLSDQTVQVQATRGMKRIEQYLRRHGVNDYC